MPKSYTNEKKIRTSHKTAIVVLNWNGIEDTLECVESLLKQSYDNYEIVIVDNNSTDSSVGVLRKLTMANSTKIQLIENKSNKGFAGGVNTGIRYAIRNNFQYVALFNNDAIADTDWLKSLHEAAYENKSSITTGLLLHRDGSTIDSSGDFYSVWGMPFPRDRNKASSQHTKSGMVFSGSGGASLYSTEMFKQVGLFDEKFFAYYEDIDISFRAQLTGHSVYYTENALAYHKQGATSNKLPGFAVYQTFKNLPLLFIKNVPRGLIVSIGIRFVCLYSLIFLNAIRNGNGFIALKGVVMAFWIITTDSAWKRFSIQRHKSVKTEYIISLLWNDLPPDQTGLRRLRAKLGFKSN